MAKVNPHLNEIVAASRPVMKALKAEADRRAAMAKAKAATRVRTGRFLDGIKVVRHVRGYAIVFDDPLSAYKNYDHITEEWGLVRGIHAVEEALR